MGRVDDGWVKYKVRGGRMSGDANTAGGNCVIMATLLYAFGQSLKTDFNFLCDGDDSVFFYRGDTISDATVQDWFRKFGFVMKIENRPQEFEDINFCQAKPVYTPDGYVMVRDPRKVLASVTVSPKMREPKGRYKYIRTVALGELSLCQGVPVLQSYLSHLEQHCKKQMTRRQLKRGHITMNAIRDSWRLSELIEQGWTRGATRPVDDRSRASFARAWGISTDRQLSMETAIQSWKPRVDDTSPGGKIDLANWS
jgi:hypothetical protein